MSDSFSILSLDGGGIKGIFSAAVLNFLEEDLGIKIIDHFDLIVGTSTGGLIALGLASGMSPKEIVEFYVENGKNIFPSNRVLSLKRYIHRKFKNKPLEDALKSCFGEKRLADCTKRLVIPSYNIGEDDVYLFKTPHHETLNRDWKVPIWKIGMATSAAPTYFPSFTSIDHVRLIDGGVWANNPTMVGITEAVSVLGQRLDSIKVFSLGTTDAVKGRPNKLDSGGIWQWRNHSIDVIMRGQSIGTHTQASHLIGKNKVYRLDPRVPDGLFKIDKLSVKALLAKAAHESRISSPKFQSMFTDHIADKFEPLKK